MKKNNKFIDELKIKEKSFLNFIDQQEEDYSTLDPKYEENEEDEIELGKYNQKKKKLNINTCDEDNLDEILAYDYGGKKKVLSPKENPLLTPKKTKQKQVEDGI